MYSFSSPVSDDLIIHPCDCMSPHECDPHTVSPSVCFTVCLLRVWTGCLMCHFVLQAVSLCWGWRVVALRSLRSPPPLCIMAFWDYSAGGLSWPVSTTKAWWMHGPRRHMTGILGLRCRILAFKMRLGYVNRTLGLIYHLFLRCV